jgi:hypothetical protein
MRGGPGSVRKAEYHKVSVTVKLERYAFSDYPRVPEPELGRDQNLRPSTMQNRTRALSA